MTSPSQGAPATNRGQILVMLMGLCLISHFSRTSMSVAGNDRIMAQFGIEPTKMGMIYSAFLLVYSIWMIPGGILIDRVGPRRALMVVGFGSAIFGALTGAAGWVCGSGAALISTLLIVRGAMGMVSAPLHPAAARAISNWFPFAQRSGANGWVTAAAIVGIALSYPGFGALIKAFDWTWAFVIAAAFTALLTVAWTFLATDQPGSQSLRERSETAEEKALPPALPEQGGEDFAGLLVNRSLLLITLSYAAVGYFQYLFAYWMQFYLERVLHVGAVQSKYYASILQLALALGMPLGGWLSAKVAHRRGVRLGRALVSGGGMGLSATLLGLGVLSHDAIWIVAWFALAHIAIGAAEGPFWATAVDIGGAKGGTSAAICNTGGNLGGLLAPWLTPLISSHLGWPWGIGMGGLICFLGALCWLGIDPRAALRRKI